MCQSLESESHLAGDCVLLLTTAPARLASLEASQGPSSASHLAIEITEFQMQAFAPALVDSGDPNSNPHVAHALPTEPSVQPHLHHLNF